MSPQVGGSPLDSLRREQTTDSCLGVKGSPGSCKAVPTQVRRLVLAPGTAFCHSGDQDRRPRGRPGAPWPQVKRRGL